MEHLEKKYPLFFVLLLFVNDFVDTKENKDTIFRKILSEYKKVNFGEENIVNQETEATTPNEFLLELGGQNSEEIPKCISFTIETITKKLDRDEVYIKGDFIYKYGRKLFRVSDKETYFSFLKGISRATIFDCYRKANALKEEANIKENSRSHISNSQLNNKHSIEFLYYFAYFLTEYLQISTNERVVYYGEVAVITKPSFYDSIIKVKVKKILDDLHIFIVDQPTVSGSDSFNGFLISMTQLFREKNMVSFDLVAKMKKINKSKCPLSYPKICGLEMTIVGENSHIYYEFLTTLRWYTLLVVETYINECYSDYSVVIKELMGDKEQNYQYENRIKLIIKLFKELSESLPIESNSVVLQQVIENKTIEELVKLYPNFMLQYLDFFQDIPIHKKLKMMNSLNIKLRKSKIIENNAEKYNSFIENGLYSEIDFFKLGGVETKDKFYLDIFDCSILEDVMEEMVN